MTPLNGRKRAVRERYEQDVEHCRYGKCFRTKHIIMTPEDLDAEIDSLLAWVEVEVSGEIRDGYYAQQVHEAFKALIDSGV